MSGSAASRRLAFAIPGSLDTPTGGYRYDANIIEGLGQDGWQVDCVALPEGFPKPSPDEVRLTEERLLSVASDVPLVIDGLAYGVLPDMGAKRAAKGLLIALVHHPLCLESGLSEEERVRFAVLEKAALAHAHHVIVTSPATARDLTARFGLPPEKLSVIEPGVARPDPPIERGRINGLSPSAPLRLLTIGSITPRKGHDVLVAALARLKDLPWTLTLIGDGSRDPGCASALKMQIAEAGLSDRIALTGATDEAGIDLAYRTHDVFVLASRYEGYGMVFSEALVYGLPVIGTKAGAIAETVPEGAGILVKPENAGELSDALGMLIENAKCRETLVSRVFEIMSDFPDWDMAAEKFGRAILVAAARIN